MSTKLNLYNNTAGNSPLLADLNKVVGCNDDTNYNTIREEYVSRRMSSGRMEKE